MFKRLKNIQVIDFIIVSLILFFSVEAINKLFFFQEYETFIAQKIIKGMAAFAMGIYLLFFKPKWLWGFLGLLLCFAIGQFFLTYSFSKISFVGYSRYFFFILWIIFTSLPIISVHKFRRLEKVFETLILINNIFIFLGVIFQWGFLSTYHEERFGYNGLFMASSNSTYFYLISLIYYLNKYKNQVFTKTNWWITIAASCFIGTKSIYLSVLLIFIYLSFLFIKNKQTKILISTVLFFMGIVGMYIFFSTNIFTAIIKENGWLTAILSTRDQQLLQTTLPYIRENWNVFNFFVGGIGSPVIRPQLEYVDLFLFFGLIGTILYLYLFIKYYFTFPIEFKIILPCFLLLFAVTCISGNFFYNASVPVYFVVLKCFLLYQKESKSKEDQ